MKPIKKMMYVLAVFCIILPFMNQNVYASTGTISFSDPSVTVGSEVTVKVKVATTDSTALGGVDLTLAYDASALQFESGTSASGEAGTIRIAGVIDSANTTSLSYTLTFKSLKAGTSKITVSSYDIINLDYEPVDISKVGNSTVTVKEKETSQASADCKLASLQISPGTLAPAFSPTTVEYSATVPYETTKLAVSATPNDSKASVTGVSGTDLSVGSNTVRVTVTAENGAAVAYVINVTRQQQVKEDSSQSETSAEDSSSSQKESSEPQEEEKAIEVSVLNALFTVVNDIPDEAVPSGFEEGSYTYQDSEVSVLKSSEGNVILFYLADQNDTKALYLYNENTDTFTEYNPISSTVSLIALEADDSVSIPDGYTAVSVTISDTEVVAYQKNENTNLYLIYAMNAAGEKALYQYDSKDGSLQRYVENTTVSEETDESEDSGEVSILKNQLQKLNAQYESNIQNRMYILYALAAVGAILLIIVINLIVKLHDTKLDEAEEEVNNEEQFEVYIENREKNEAKENLNNTEDMSNDADKKTKKEKNKKKKQQEDEATNDSQMDGREEEDSDFTFIDLDDDNLK